MKIIAVSDIHGDAAAAVRLGSRLAEADLVLVSGDITNFGGRKEAAEILEKLGVYCPRILAVPGNCDRPEVGGLLAERGWSLDGRTFEIEGLYLLGVGGSLPCPGRTLLEYSEEDLAQILESACREIPGGKPFVLLCHQPPYGTKTDRVFGGLHVGSRAIRGFIEDKKPLACLCGHIHESPGTDGIGETTVCNPGPLATGGLVRAEWQWGQLSVRIESFRA